MLVAVALCAGFGPGVRMRHVLPLQPRAHVAATEEGPDWRLQEDWALLESTAQFTVGTHGTANTFWTELIASAPDLCNRTPAECHARMDVLVAESGRRIAHGPQPPVLSSWQKLTDGRYTGICTDGKQIWMSPAMEGRLPTLDTTAGINYIQTSAGQIFALGDEGEATGLGMMLPQTADASASEDVLARVLVLSEELARVIRSARQPLTAVALCLVMPVALGGLMATVDAAPSPEYGPFGTPGTPSRHTQYLIRTEAPPPGYSYLHIAKQDQPPATVGEQYARQERIVANEEARLGELARAIAQRGADAKPLPQVFPEKSEWGI